MVEPSTGAPPPRILLLVPEHWTRALLRAALLDVGYDAIGAGSIEEAMDYPTDDPGRGAVRLVVVDSRGLRAEDTAALPQLIRKHREPIAVLIAPATLATPEGSWRRVLRRPLSIGEIVRETQSLLPLPATGPVAERE